jgi:DNA-binding phage protein
MALLTTEDDAKFILNALTTIPLQMNFTEVAKAIGMKQSGHA